jgi:hypothetical protein
MEEEKYCMSDLIMFLLGQSESCYRTVEQILDLIDDDSIPFETKNSMIKELFRKEGLVEIGFEEKEAPAKHKRPISEDPINLTGIKMPVAQYLMKWLNTLELITIFLN